MKRKATQRRKVGDARPELDTLTTELERWGVDGAPAIVHALAVGSQWYAERLGADAPLWRRYRAALLALRDCRCPLDLCDVVIGALAWTYVDGEAFIAEVTRRTATPSSAVH